MGLEYKGHPKMEYFYSYQLFEWLCWAGMSDFINHFRKHTLKVRFGFFCIFSPFSLS